MGFNALWWWIDRWRKSTAYTDMTLEQQGAYRNLLDEATLRGGLLPVDERILAKACGDATRWKALRTVLLARFTRTEEGYRNSTLDEVLKEGQRRKDKQKRWRDKRGNGGGNSSGNAPGNTVGLAEVSQPVTGAVLRSLITDHSSVEARDQPLQRGRARSARLAYGGKVLEVPKFLDEEFVRRLNGQVFDLTGFYDALEQRLVQTGEVWDLRWIREQFDAESPKPARRAPHANHDRPFSEYELREGRDWYRRVGCALDAGISGEEHIAHFIRNRLRMENSAAS